MDSKFYGKYFGRNIARILYLIGVGFLGFGASHVVFGNPFIGMFFCTIGVVIFFLTSHKNVSDKHIDELVSKYQESYIINKIDGKTHGKEILNGKDFSVFSGFIRDDGNVRFKAGSDQKIRTSRFYITAISAKKNDFKVYTTVYDILSQTEPLDKSFFIKTEDITEFLKEEVQFPRGNYKCTLKTAEQEFVFYIPNDALADKLISKLA